MAAPNIKSGASVTVVTGKTGLYACTASLAAALTNTTASGKVLKINVIRAASIGGSSNTIDVSIYRNSVHTYLIKGASVPSGGSLVVLNRDEYVYLEEGDAIYAKANAVSVIDLTLNYEEIL